MATTRRSPNSTRIAGPPFLGVCRHYLPDEHEAEDAMIQSMYKALTGLDISAMVRTVPRLDTPDRCQ